MRIGTSVILGLLLLVTLVMPVLGCPIGEKVKNVTYAELLLYLDDFSARYPRNTPETSTWVCGEWSQALYNDAKAKNLRVAIVIDTAIFHAFNLFETTDKGRVYVDMTSARGREAVAKKQDGCYTISVIINAGTPNEQIQTQTLYEKDFEVHW